MRVQAEPSDIWVDIDGVECRVWNAVTEDGEQMFMFVHRVATRADFSGTFLPRIVQKIKRKEPHEA